MTISIMRLVKILETRDFKLSKAQKEDIIFYLKRVLETNLKNKKLSKENIELKIQIKNLRKKIKIL